MAKDKETLKPITLPTGESISKRIASQVHHLNTRLAVIHRATAVNATVAELEEMLRVSASFRKQGKGGKQT